MGNPLKPLYLYATAYTALGLLGGLFYREFTKMNDFQGRTQLSVVHTHFLVLGAFAFLTFMALEKLFGLSATPRRFRAFLITWNAGLLLTGTMMVIKGCLQVLDHPMADSPMIAGISGLGHMSVTAGMILLLSSLGSRVGAFTSIA